MRPATSLTLSLFALTACTSPQPTPIPSSTPEVIFASEEEALAAVTATFETYQALSYTILAEGGSNPERLAAIATPDVTEVEYAGYRMAAEGGYSFTGTPSIASITLVFWLANPDPLSVLARAEICIDITDVQVTDSTGASAVNVERRNLSRWSVDFSEGNDEALIVSAKDLLDGECR
ncbi:Lipoprotein [Plantibacter sp. RU18]